MYAQIVLCVQPTSIRIQATTRDHLQRLKEHPRESFDDVITRLIDATADDEPLSEETLATIEQSLKEYREGMYYTPEEILAELDVADEPVKGKPANKSSEISAKNPPRIRNNRDRCLMRYHLGYSSSARHALKHLPAPHKHLLSNRHTQTHTNTHKHTRHHTNKMGGKPKP